MKTSPSILAIGGHDPIGGAGIAADIETAAALSCRIYTLVTCLTTQDSRNVASVYPQPLPQLEAQLRCLLEDVRPDVIKVGLLGDTKLAERLLARIEPLGVPIVLDPVLAAGGGQELANQALLRVLRDWWLPQTFLLTPNRAEARRLSFSEDLPEAMQLLLRSGCQHVLLTGADEASGIQVRNSLYGKDQPTLHFDWPRLPHTYHGSGCTLASACACLLARGMDLPDAVRQAQSFTWQSLRRAERPGQGQHLPVRWPAG